MELQHETKKIILSKWRQLVKEESTDIFNWEPSIVSLNQKPHKKNQNKSMQGVEMNPNLYCVSLVGDSWAWETYSNTCSLAQLLLTEPPPPSPLSPLHPYTLHVALTSQSVPLHCNLQPPDTHTHIFTCTHSSLFPACPLSSPSSDSRLDSQ